MGFRLNEKKKIIVMIELKIYTKCILYMHKQGCKNDHHLASNRNLDKINKKKPINNYI